MNKSPYSKEYKKLARKLKSKRLEAGLEQKDLAKKLNKAQSYISKIEEGKLHIDIFELKTLSKLCKKDINYFINSEEHRSAP